ncbi:MAG: 2-hydroxychromene-2-carboxylate isomerase [Gammaproteobacteria bacterium]|jgi:2-hydroxychromene-2-carboxylate isomerase|nr:2-hydroxychromene-2-carboxylate isomerase [Gammaproteobacteria bacterium]MBP6052393.1 2-hydroxychromene-2-carboxylate isomerase [Pseudomonadales bacterium]MBK6584843.1 2-hydroxychromene-2-carboxylate isomerase [Gammaproteobacteria bacterium]MBK7170018.1 2-hydroxychromene-2-carboxylate isomerase [Gammaproteobacteria bacterium]MBK7731108.1 2-hydroxychromene-2-carboxylate isomerase [Gammaproteobacteria bacterium]
MRLEFFFDCSSPWTYLAFAGIQPLAARVGVSIEWKPILVGGVFNSVNPEVYSARANPNPRRMDHMRKDLQDWARLYGLEIGWPAVFPVNSVKAMRGVLVAEEAGLLVPYTQAVFERYWRDLQDISSDEVVADIARGVGLDERAFMAAIARPACKERLRANTDELIERGGFGTPTMFVNGSDMYFGNDRLVLVEHALLAR